MVCTLDGLNRYDGYDFKVLRAGNSDPIQLSSSLIKKVVEDENGYIWIATIYNGINIFNPSTHEIIEIKNTIDQPDLITHNQINDIICDSKNRIIATTPGGANIISLINGEVKIQKIPKPEKGDDVFSDYFGAIMETKRGEYLFCSRWDINKLETDAEGNFTGKISTCFHHENYEGYHNFIEVEGGIIVGVWFEVAYIVYDDKTGNYNLQASIRSNTNVVFAQDQNQNLWVGGSNGLSYFKHTPENNFPFTLKKECFSGTSEFDLSNDFIRDLYIDETHTLWVSTYGGGVNKYDPNKRRFRKYSHSSLKGSLSHNKVISITEDSEGNVWFGTEGGGMNLLPVSEKKNYNSGFTHFDVSDLNHQNTVYDIVEIQDKGEKKILAGTSFTSLLVEFSKKNQKWVTHYPQINTRSMNLGLLYDSEKNLWLCSYTAGLLKAKYSNSELTFQQFKKDNSQLPSNLIRSGFEDSKKRLWFGTRKGLILMDSLQRKSDSLEFTLFQHNPKDPNSISYNYILPIFENSKGEIWIGTFGGGINIYVEPNNEKQGYFKKISLKEGLPNPVIKDILEDRNGTMWISTNNGLSSYNSKTSTIRNYGIKDGLQDKEFGDRSACILSDGEILFGGVNGFSAFYPHEIKEDTVTPKIVINDFELMNKFINVGDTVNGRILLSKSPNHTDKITLKHEENSFTIHFAALHYTAPESNQFKYMLEGFDNDWIRTTPKVRFAKYTNLNPGQYSFKVIAANGDGKWVDTPKTIRIIVETPLWKTTKFRLIVSIILVTLILLTTYLKIKSIKRKNIILKRALDKANEADKLKNAFLANLSHEIRTPMNAIIGFSEILKVELDEDKLLGSYAEVVDSNAKSLLTLIDDMIDLSMIESNQFSLQKEYFPLNEFLNHIYQFYVLNNKIENRKILLNNTLESENLSLYSDQTRLKQIISNFMNNAFKFTNEGFIELGVKQNFDNVIFYVKDTGRGIPQDKLDYIFKRFTKVISSEFKLLEGLGIGLSICRSISQQLGGDIKAESTEGKGSTFTLRIPQKNLKRVD